MVCDVGCLNALGPVALLRAADAAPLSPPLPFFAGRGTFARCADLRGRSMWRTPLVHHRHRRRRRRLRMCKTFGSVRFGLLLFSCLLRPPSRCSSSAPPFPAPFHPVLFSLTPSLRQTSAAPWHRWWRRTLRPRRPALQIWSCRCRTRTARQCSISTTPARINSSLAPTSTRAIRTPTRAAFPAQTTTPQAEIQLMVRRRTPSAHQIPCRLAATSDASCAAQQQARLFIALCRAFPARVTSRSLPTTTARARCVHSINAGENFYHARFLLVIFE